MSLSEYIKALIVHILSFGRKNMSYLHSLLDAELSAEEADLLLCYYINDSTNLQIIRVINDAKQLIERVAFQGERILFRAMPKSHLEVCTVLAEGTRLSTIDCKSLQVNKPVLQDRLAELFK
ncbi:MAG: DUF1830 domain-containing protein [Oscillatoriophycideae cyanobacterium NC_groundwater_1537_Pr4_S-0.65um_50_18]|nr:DUF1830 domain-containing protein [Oscillatoriophycideae cyanobacterium NC_groundwater_1537_Pr4_S-0.65um_50_18]